MKSVARVRIPLVSPLCLGARGKSSNHRSADRLTRCEPGGASIFSLVAQLAARQVLDREVDGANPSEIVREIEAIEPFHLTITPRPAVGALLDG